MAADGSFIQGFFRNLPQLSVLDDQEIVWLAARARKHKYLADKFVFYQDEKINDLYFLEFGRVEVFKSDINGKKLTLWYIGDDEMFCLANLYTVRAFANARTITDSLIYSIAREDFDQLAQRSGKLSHNLIRCMSAKMSSYSKLLDDLAFKRIEGRLATILLSRIPFQDTTGMICKMTQEELAAMAGTSREVIARCLKSFREKGLVKNQSVRPRSPLIITNYSRLKKIAQG